MKAAVLGSPIAHSLSPALHNAAYQELGIDIDYTAIDTPIQQLAQRISQLSDDDVGYSLTMPLKGDVQVTVLVAVLKSNSRRLGYLKPSV